MKPRRMRIAIAAALMTGLSMLNLSGAPAEAASVIHASFSLDFNPPPGPGVMNARTLVHVETNLYDGVGYMVNGARIELRYWGSDTGSDQFLAGPHIYYNGAPGLWVDDDGIWLDNLFQAPASVFNEDDSLFNRTDEIYVTAKFIDGDGAIIQTNSNEVHIFL